MRKIANICSTVAALAFAFAANAGDAVAGETVKDSLSGIELSGGTDTASVPHGGDNAVSNGNKGNGDTASTINTVNTIDTANAVNAGRSDGDTAGHGNNQEKLIAASGNDSAAINKRQPPPKLNADPPPLSGAYWGFGAGLSVGTVPIFPMWQEHFPTSLRLLGLSPAFAVDTSNRRDTISLRYRVIESPDAFNFALPFYISLYGIGEKHAFAFTVSFFRNDKEFQTTLDIADTVTRRINAVERLVYYSASIEASANLAIPPIFFSVDGSQQTFLSLALGASPVNTFTRECEIQADFKDGDARMRAVADSVGKTFAAISGNGLSISWRVGISVLKRYPSGHGAEFGLFYSGAYSNYFYSDGVRLSEDHLKTRGADINAQSVTSGKPLSFLSNQAEFKATLLVPAKKKVSSD